MYKTVKKKIKKKIDQQYDEDFALNLRLFLIGNAFIYKKKKVYCISFSYLARRQIAVKISSKNLLNDLKVNVYKKVQYKCAQGSQVTMLLGKNGIL